MSLPVGPKMMVRTVGHARLTIDPLAYCTPIRRPRTDDLSNRETHFDMYTEFHRVADELRGHHD